MKNQYFGDENDYQKYGLLRLITRSTGLRIGVCWMLTENDGSADGNRRQYLANKKQWRHFDPRLYDSLSQLGADGVAPSVSYVSERDLIPDAIYFSSVLLDDLRQRQIYFKETLSTLNACPIIFFDPDNGIEVTSTRAGCKGSAKYVYWSEIKEAYSSGHSLLIYQHFPRQKREVYIPRMFARLNAELSARRVHAYQTGNVVFFLVGHDLHLDALSQAHDLVDSKWTSLQKNLCHYNPAAPGNTLTWPFTI